LRTPIKLTEKCWDITLVYINGSFSFIDDVLGGYFLLGHSVDVHTP